MDFRISALVLADGIVWHAVHDSFDESKSGLYGVDEAAAAAAAA